MLLILAWPAWALDESPPTVQEAAPAAETVAEPEITILERADSVIEEYRMAGRLYMVKVIPTHGMPYYLMDTDGDGSLETTRWGIAENRLIPQWILFRW
jgi:hypothetical protein